MFIATGDLNTISVRKSQTTYQGSEVAMSARSTLLEMLTALEVSGNARLLLD